MFNLFKKSNKNNGLIIDQIKNKLMFFKDPLCDNDIINSQIVSSILFKDGDVKIIFETDKKDAAKLIPLVEPIKTAIGEIKNVTKVSVLITSHSQSQTKSPIVVTKPKPNTQSIRPQGIGKLIAVGSGKGGVGKSTIALNLALALHRQGKNVGLLDADIYGPSVPTLLGLVNEKAQANENGKIEPIEAMGLKAISIGFVVEKDKALIWRGPMLLKALTQLFMGTNWGALDYLIIDLPPGTGDVQLSMAQQANIDGVIMVSTPQEMALADVRRGIDMFEKANVKILGLVENMSLFIDENSGAKIDLYGHGGVKTTAQNLNIPFLGEINFYSSLQKASDIGQIASSQAIAQFDEIAQSIL